MLISQEVIIACVYLAIVPPILIIKQLKHEKQLAELQERNLSQIREAAEKCRQETEKIKARSLGASNNETL